jgi:DNA-3-methyladenine glycosylase I
VEGTIAAPLKRCPWSGNDPLYVDYHDREWGVPVHDDRKLFEFLILEGMQAGLSWLIVLRKRENFRRAFAGFDAEKVARFGKRDIRRLMADPGIVRNELKILAAVTNAAAVLRVREEVGSLDKYLWQFVDGTPRVNRRHGIGHIPAKTAQSDAMSRDLKQRGFKFVGSTICYAHMQATGMVNDHVTSCFRYRELTSPKGPK